MMLFIVPSKVVDKPKATVGIGDAISAGAFAAMLARMKQNKGNKCLYLFNLKAAHSVEVKKELVK